MFLKKKSKHYKYEPVCISGLLTLDISLNNRYIKHFFHQLRRTLSQLIRCNNGNVNPSDETHFKFLSFFFLHACLSVSVFVYITLMHGTSSHKTDCHGLEKYVLGLTRPQFFKGNLDLVWDADGVFANVLQTNGNCIRVLKRIHRIF